MDNWWLEPVADSFRTLRNVDRLSAIVPLAEIGDVRHFPKAGFSLARYGLLPPEHTNVVRRHTGSFTKTGNGTVRRVLIEGA